MRKRDLPNDIEYLKSEVLKYRGKHLWYEQQYNKKIMESKITDQRLRYMATLIKEQDEQLNKLLVLLNK